MKISDICFLEMYGIITENFMKGEAEAYEELANDESYSIEKRKVFKSNAIWYKGTIERYKNILERIEEEL